MTATNTSLHDAAAEAARLSEGAVSSLTLRIRAVAGRIGCTEGQVYSMAISLTVATLLALFGAVPLGKAPAASAAPGFVATPETPGTAIRVGTPTLTPDPVALPTLPAVELPPVSSLPMGDLPPVTTPLSPLPEPTDAPTQLPTQEPTQNLTVTNTAWYSLIGPGDTVPDRTLPVAAVLGQIRNLTVLTLQGHASELVLKETDDAQTTPETAEIRLCPLDQGETYQPGAGQNLLDAPAYDCGGGADGVRDSSGKWTFYLPFGFAGGDFALVPQAVASPVATYTVYLAPQPTQ